MANCLYNGVELLKIPVVEGHPYVVVECTFTGLGLKAKAYFFTVPVYAIHISGVAGRVEFRSMQAGKWEYWNLYSDWKQMGTGGISPSDGFTGRFNNQEGVSWTNTDIYNEDGTLYLAASDPIPVTPAEPINPTAMLMGWLAGERIVGMRGNVVQPEQPSGVYDDAFPIEWNILGTGGNAGFTLDGENFVKVSNLAPSSLANMSVSAQYQGQTFDFVMTEAENNDSFAGSATWSLAYFYCEEMDITLKMHSLSAGFTLGAWVVPEAGLYVTDFSAMGLSVDVTIEETV